MIRLTRLAAEPRILAEKKVEWFAAHRDEVQLGDAKRRMGDA